MLRIPLRRRIRLKSNQFRLFCHRLEDRLAPATFTVTTLTDNVSGSLREAITLANTTTTADDIIFQSSLTGTITLNSGELYITNPLTIDGPGITVSGNKATRVFNTFFAPSGAKVNFKNLGIVNGKGPGSGFGSGGGIFAFDQSLSLTNCTISGNSTPNRSGGGIDVSGSLTLLNCSITNNHADNFGGGILCSFGVATITGCTLTGNTAGEGGGGIMLSSTSLTLTNSTLSGNSANRGGGLYFNGEYGSSNLFVRNSTLSGNTSTITGGGIRLSYFDGTLTVQNSTITANTAGGFGGGGIGRVSNGTGNIVLESTIVSGNTDTIDANDDLFTGGTVTAKFSAVGKSTGVTTFNDDAVTTTLLGATLKLGPLASNGGTGGQTHLPAAGSPVIDSGSNPAGLTTDQRGVGFPRVSGLAADIGAFERGSTLVTNVNNSGNGSLRQAVLSANALAGADTITFDPTVFTSPETIKLTTGEISITTAITITGPAAKLTINGNSASRIFNTSGAAAKTAVLISGLTLTGGKTTSSGGAIFLNDEALTLNNCVVTGNTSGAGGGIYVLGTAGSLTLLGCTVSNNSTTGSDAEGGGIFLYDGSATIRDTTISGNTATGGGGGIVVYLGGSLLLENSTLSANKSIDEVGGGLWFSGTVASGGLTIRNSTISGNTSGDSGGGIALSGFTGKLVVENSTFTNNTANGANGGGIALLSVTGTVSLSSTIVAGNLNANTPDLSFNAPTAVSGNNNLIGVADVGNFSMTGNGNQTTGTKASPFNAKLAPLADNGGPTQTHALLAASPAINMGNNAGILSTDQRGTGFARIVDGVADVGAFERPSTVVTNTSNSGIGSLRQAVLNANALAGADTIVFNTDPSLGTDFSTPQTIKLVTGELSISGAVTVTGSAVQVTIDGGKFRILSLNTLAPGSAVVLQNLKLTNGNATDFGGAIQVGNEALKIQNCSITNCTSSSGAIYVDDAAGSVLIEDSTLSGNNAANGSGGAIRLVFASTVIIRRSALVGNTASFSGGAIQFLAGGNLFVEDSTFSGNVASETNTSLGGGAIMFSGAAGKSFISNSTLSGNKATAASGGAICLSNFTGTIFFQNSTITANATSANGGGIARTSGTGTITLSSTIVAGNTNANTPDLSFNGVTNNISGNNNLVGVVDAGNFALTGNNNLIGTKAVPFDAKLESLGNNGGLTRTHALKAGSPAINMGNNAAGLTTDQRGIGFTRWNGNAPDIGAFEVQPTAPPTVSKIQIDNDSGQRSMIRSIKVTFSEALTFPNGIPASVSLQRTVALSGGALGSVNVAGSQLGNVVTLTFLNGGAVTLDPGKSLPDGKYTLTLVANNIAGVVGFLDGNKNGTAQGSPTDNVSTNFHRLFGDNDGDAAVTSVDFAEFRKTFGTSINLAFDFDNDGNITSNDFAEFRKRFGLAI